MRKGWEFVHGFSKAFIQQFHPVLNLFYISLQQVRRHQKAPCHAEGQNLYLFQAVALPLKRIPPETLRNKLAFQSEIRILPTESKLLNIAVQQ